MSWEDEAQKGNDRAREVRKSLDKQFEQNAQERAEEDRKALERHNKGRQEHERQEG